VGLARLELATSPLSGVRSNQLSYSPGGAYTLLGVLAVQRADRTAPENRIGVRSITSIDRVDQLSGLAP